MVAPAEVQLVRYTPVELVAAVRDGHIRYPHPGHPSTADIARTLGGIQLRYPQQPLVLWRDPADAAGSPLWLLDGGKLVSALLLATGLTDRQVDEEPVFLDTDTGEIVSWGQRPDLRHALVDLPLLLAAGNAEDHLASERLVGERADRALGLLRSMAEPLVLAQIVEVPRSELPVLLAHLAPRSGATLSHIDAHEEPHPEPPRPLMIAARAPVGILLSLDDYWRAVLVAEGLEPDLPYDPAASPTALPDEGREAIRFVDVAQRAVRARLGFGRGRMAPDPATVAVVARFLRVFPAMDDATWTLLRRWAWRAALTDDDLDLSPYSLAVIRDDAASSALRLLDRTPAPEPTPPGRKELDLSTPHGRLALLGLASLHPRDLGTGVLVDIEEAGPHVILGDRPPELANLVLQRAPHLAGFRDMSEAILDARNPELLDTHGIDVVAINLLRTRDDDGFLARRAAELDRVVPAFWATMTEPSAAVRRPIAMLFEDDHVG